MISNTGLNGRGALEIQKRLKNFKPFLTKPNIVTEMNTKSANIPVTAAQQ